MISGIRITSRMKIKASYCLLLVVTSAALGLGGCADYYAGYPGYGPYYSGANYGGPYYGRPYYGGYPGSVTVAVGDRPYYTRGPGYWSGNRYYVWKPGHWVYRNGQKVWRRGHYVVRGY